MSESRDPFKPKYTHNEYDRERSEKLMEAAGVDWTFTVFSGKLLIVRSDGSVIGEGTLYEPGNMALAWLVNLWAYEEVHGYKNYAFPWDKLPAQRLWLDKIHDLIS